MPTPESVARRRQLAMERLTNSKEAISQKLGIDLEPLSKRGIRDLDLLEVINLEEAANHFETVFAALNPAEESKPEDEVKGIDSYGEEFSLKELENAKFYDNSTGDVIEKTKDDSQVEGKDLSQNDESKKPKTKKKS